MFTAVSVNSIINPLLILALSITWVLHKIDDLIINVYNGYVPIGSDKCTQTPHMVQACIR